MYKVEILAAAIILAVANIPQVSAPAHAFGGVAWRGSLEEGLAEAKAKKKYVLADVYTKWCKWCPKLDKDTFQDRAMVQYLKEQFVCVKINAEGSKSARATAKKYRVHGYPCALIFDDKGKFLGRLSGYMEPDKYRNAVEELIAHPTTASAD
jgi:thioredoxin-related protein